MERGARSFDSARRATVRICTRARDHLGQGLLLDLEDEGLVVLTCHHVVAGVSAEELSITIRGADGAFSAPVPAKYVAERSRPGRDAVVLKVTGIPRPRRPLLHALNSAAYSGTLSRRATAITCWKTDTFDARIGAPTGLDLKVEQAGSWPDPPERYVLPHVYRLADATDARPGISGSVVTYEDGVLGLAHFSRPAGPDHEREVYLVPLETWAENWPALANLIVPLVDGRLRAAAKVAFPGDLRVETDILIAAYRPDVYVERPAAGKARAVLARNGALLIVGRPKSGKTRLAWELIQERPETLIVVPGKAEPPAEFEESTFRGRDTLLFFDDLHQAAHLYDPLAWHNRFQEVTGGQCSLICTSRDGGDWAKVREAPRLAALLATAGEASCVFLSKGEAQGEDLTEAEGRAIASALQMSASEFAGRFDGTPGSLTLDLSGMRERYRRLSDELPGGIPMSRLLDSAKLLYVGGQRKLPSALIRAVAARVRGEGRLTAETWERMRRRTVEEGFGEFEAGTGEFHTYRPYLEQCVLYEPEVEEIEALLPLLREAKEYEGLLGLASALQERGSALAEAACRACLEGGPMAAAYGVLAWILLEEGGRDAEAEEACRSEIAAGSPFGWVVLARLLSRQPGREAEAEEAFRQALDSGVLKGSPYLGTLHTALGVLLARQAGRESDAEAAFRNAIATGKLAAYTHLTHLLLKQPGREAEVEVAFRDAIAAGHVESYSGLGTFLVTKAGREREAEAAYRAAVDAGVADDWDRQRLEELESRRRWVERPRQYWLSAENTLVAAPVTLEWPAELAEMVQGDGPGSVSAAAAAQLDRALDAVWFPWGAAPSGICIRLVAGNAQQYRMLVGDVPVAARRMPSDRPLEGAVDHLKGVILTNLAELTGHQEIVSGLRFMAPEAAGEVSSEPAVLTDLTIVCRALLAEFVPLRALRKIAAEFRALRSAGTPLPDIVERLRMLDEVRRDLPPNRWEHQWILLDPAFEKWLAGAMDRDGSQPVLALGLDQCREALDCVRAAAEELKRQQAAAPEHGVAMTAFVVGNPTLRACFHRLVALEYPLFAVISRTELLPSAVGQAVATVRLSRTKEAS